MKEVVLEVGHEVSSNGPISDSEKKTDCLCMWQAVISGEGSHQSETKGNKTDKHVQLPDEIFFAKVRS